MRGQKTYKELIKGSGLDNTLRKGRNNTLLAMRNDSLIARYYYYGYIKSKSYEDTLQTLVTEFFLSPFTIANVVMEHSDEVYALKQKSPTIYYFQHRWPHMKW